jgi:hypothetical protein
MERTAEDLWIPRVPVALEMLFSAGFDGVCFGYVVGVIAIAESGGTEVVDEKDTGTVSLAIQEGEKLGAG